MSRRAGLCGFRRWARLAKRTPAETLEDVLHQQEATVAKVCGMHAELWAPTFDALQAHSETVQETAEIVDRVDPAGLTAEQRERLAAAVRHAETCLDLKRSAEQSFAAGLASIHAAATASRAAARALQSAAEERDGQA